MLSPRRWATTSASAASSSSTSAPASDGVPLTLSVLTTGSTSGFSTGVGLVQLADQIIAVGEDAVAADQRRRRVVQGPLHTVHGPIQQPSDQRLVLDPADFQVQVQRRTLFLGNEFLFDPRERVVRQVPFGRFDRSLGQERARGQTAIRSGNAAVTAGSRAMPM